MLLQAQRMTLSHWVSASTGARPATARTRARSAPRTARATRTTTRTRPSTRTRSSPKSAVARENAFEARCAVRGGHLRMPHARWTRPIADAMANSVYVPFCPHVSRIGVPRHSYGKGWVRGLRNQKACCARRQQQNRAFASGWIGNVRNETITRHLPMRTLGV